MAAKYIIKQTDLTMRMQNEKGEVVSLSDKPLELKVEKSIKYPEGLRKIEPATQEDLRYFYEKLGARKFIIKQESTEIKSNTKAEKE